MATRQLLGVLCRRWTEISGQPVHLESVGGVDAVHRIEAGEAFDVAVLAADALKKLSKTDRVTAISELAVSDVAVACAPGNAPQITTVEQLQLAMDSARTIGYSTGPSGKALLGLLAQWQVLDSLQPKLVMAPPGVAVGDLIARREVDLGFQQRSELIHCAGIQLLGAMPPGAEIFTVFSAARCAAAEQPDQAAALIHFLSSSACAEVIRAEGMLPLSWPSPHA